MKKFIKKVFILLIIELITVSVISNSAFYDIDYGPDSKGMADYTEEETKKESQNQLNTSNNNSQEYVGKSSNNYLKSLQIENEKLDKEFQKEILDYEVNLKDKNSKKIKIFAIADDEKAVVRGAGEVKLNEGINNVQIVVTAENGNVQIYNLKINVSDTKVENTEVIEPDTDNTEIIENKDDLVKIIEESNESYTNLELKFFIIGGIIFISILILFCIKKNKGRKKCNVK